MKIQLLMLVRNEAARIRDCLEAARPHITSYCILDTGSDDGTQDLIRETLRDLPGALHEHPFEGFAASRTRLFDLARETDATHLLLLDADMQIEWPDELPALTADAYEGRVQYGQIDYALPILVRADREWRYEGAAHAYLTAADGPFVTLPLPGLRIHAASSAKPEKFQRDHAALTQEHARNPLDPRTTFYLAQTCQDFGLHAEAIQHYRARANQPGWDEETFYARYRLGCLLGENVNGLEGMRELLAAWEQRPGRAEPLRALANLANSIADKIPYPADRLFVHSTAYKRPAAVAKTVEDVTAIIVTRGDVDLTDILATLPYTETIVWDNSQRPENQKCYGRFLAMAEATNDLIYLQDDDVVFTEHAALRAAHLPGRITANMPSPWYEAGGYDKEQSVQVGAGSLMERDLPWPAFDAYLTEWPPDDLFLTYCDDVAGILCPSHRVDLGYEVLPHASAPGRIYTTEGSQARRAEVARRALVIRSKVTA